jgi:hypothetical protein
VRVAFGEQDPRSARGDVPSVHPRDRNVSPAGEEAAELLDPGPVPQHALEKELQRRCTYARPVASRARSPSAWARRIADPESAPIALKLV